MLSAGLGTIIWTSVAFLIVLFLLKKMAWKPILKSLKERDDFIEKSLESAEEARKQMSQLKADNEKLLAEARQEREQILKEAREMKEKIISDARKTATDEGDRLVNMARNEIAKEKNAAMAELKNQVASLSIEIAEKLIRKEFESKDQQQFLIDEQLKTAQMN